jgi:hypothetical protein
MHGISDVPLALLDDLELTKPETRREDPPRRVFCLKCFEILPEGETGGSSWMSSCSQDMADVLEALTPKNHSSTSPTRRLLCALAPVNYRMHNYPRVGVEGVGLN